jgi:hypothetical protein
MHGSLSATWLSAKLGLDPSSLDSARRDGRLLGVNAGDHYEYPAWQFDEDGKVLAGLPGIIGAARAAGMTDDRLGALMQAGSGLGSGRCLADALRDGNVDHVLGVIQGS